MVYPCYQSVLPNQQQGFQGLMGMQHPPQSQNLMNNQQGNQVQGMMVQYPAMSSYQVPRHFSEFLHFGEHVAKRKANTMSREDIATNQLNVCGFGNKCGIRYPTGYQYFAVISTKLSTIYQFRLRFGRNSYAKVLSRPQLLIR
ncbi:hypothetical protein lerEdw1_012807 [Lerista edwardsae]|nr:hypothetical protein lerEdw1_012807 [Lerista edwardsae]